MHAEEFTLDIRPTFIDELDKTVAYIETKLKNPNQTEDEFYAKTRANSGNS